MSLFLWGGGRERSVEKGLLTTWESGNWVLCMVLRTFMALSFAHLSPPPHSLYATIHRALNKGPHSFRKNAWPINRCVHQILWLIYGHRQTPLIRWQKFWCLQRPPIILNKSLIDSTNVAKPSVTILLVLLTTLGQHHTCILHFFYSLLLVRSFYVIPFLIGADITRALSGSACIAATREIEKKRAKKKKNSYQL